MDDLSAWVSYKGWDRFNNFGTFTYQHRYLKAVEEGRIPQLKSQKWALDSALKVIQVHFDLGDFMFTLESIGLDPDHPELLPDAQLGTLRGKEANSNER